MSYNSVASEVTSSQKYNLIWPESLETIKMTEEERDLLQTKIESIRDGLPPKTASNDPYAFSFRDSSCPRRLFVSYDHCFVVLNFHGGMPKFDSSGAQQKKIKYVWDCKTGSFWLKKAFFSSKQADCIKYLRYAPDLGKSSLGLPRLVTDIGPEHNKGKRRYFEEMAMLSLPKWLEKFGPRLDITYLIGLMDSLRKIHSVKYQPASFIFLGSTKGYCNFDASHILFHGDISPNNVICEKVEDKENGSIYPKLMFTDFYSLGDVNSLLWTSGWASPECIQFAKTHTKYQEMDVSNFMAKYGAKKDTWAMGLLIGSLIIGGMNPNFKQNLPCFSFITNKLKFDSTGQFVVDESGLADITQEEIDSKIDALIEEEPTRTTKMLWGCVKKYLTVNPDERPTMAEFFLGIS